MQPYHLSPKQTLTVVRETLDRLPDHAAVLDASGRIVAVNRAWSSFALQTGADPATTGEGADYLAVCERAADSDWRAGRFANALRDVLSGRRTAYEMDSWATMRGRTELFRARVSPFEEAGRAYVLVRHTNLNARRALQAA